MERRERASDERIAQPSEPVPAVSRQRLQVPADDVDEHQFAQSTEHTLSADSRLLRLGQRAGGSPGTLAQQWPRVMT